MLIFRFANNTHALSKPKLASSFLTLLLPVLALDESFLFTISLCFSSLDYVVDFVLLFLPINTHGNFSLLTEHSLHISAS
jgi:hypothetical protein